MATYRAVVTEASAEHLGKTVDVQADNLSDAVRAIVGTFPGGNWYNTASIIACTPRKESAYVSIYTKDHHEFQFGIDIDKI